MTGQREKGEGGEGKENSWRGREKEGGEGTRDVERGQNIFIKKIRNILIMRPRKRDWHHFIFILFFILFHNRFIGESTPVSLNLNFGLSIFIISDPIIPSNSPVPVCTHSPAMLSYLLAVVCVAAIANARVHYALAEDLYAFPKYRVAFLNALPLRNTTAELWLKEGLHGGERQFLDQQWLDVPVNRKQISSGDHTPPDRPPTLALILLATTRRPSEINSDAIYDASRGPVRHDLTSASSSRLPWHTCLLHA